MRIDTCYYCSGPIYPGHGIHFVRNDAKIFKFCRSKCHRHFKRRHHPIKSKWTKTSRAHFHKELINDPVLEFEKKRNVVTKYNRDTMIKTIQSMKRISELKYIRQKRFWLERMRKEHAKQIGPLEKELEKHVDLIQDPRIREEIEEHVVENKKREKDRYVHIENINDNVNLKNDNDMDD
eukprot:Mrub_12463.p1 GENE.Mrub_12463~~Mrub_12463.p1  ORF type:complete len:179 (-),score=49.83 Mrub_12463:25-561(-)